MEFKGGNSVRKAQYDDIYTEWIENHVFLEFDEYEDEEAFARHLARLYH